MTRDQPGPSSASEGPRVAGVEEGSCTEAWAVPLDGPRHPAGNGDVLSPEQWRALADSLSLSAREIEIVRCLFHDKTEREAAYDLSVSVNTVHTHLSRVYRKLGVSTRCGLAARVLTAYRATESETTNEH